MIAQNYVPHQYSPKRFLVIALLVVAALMLVALDIMPQRTTASDPVMEVVYSHPGFNLTQAPALSYNQVTLPEGFMPDFPQCNAVTPSRWCWYVSESEYEDGRVINIDLMGDGRSIANHQFLEMNASELELARVMAPYSDKVWLSAIKVMRIARFNGIGKLMWSAGDKVLSYLTGCDGGSCVYHVFYNASGSESWIRSIYQATLANKFYVIYKTSEYFIYEIPAW